MQPIPIPEDVIKRAQELGWKSQVIAGPDGDLISDTVRPVDALTGVVDFGDGDFALHINVLCEATPDEITALQENGGRFWITFTGSIVPFSLQLFEETTPDANSE